MELDNLELNPDVEVFKPPLEYTTHEQYLLEQERLANRKLKAEIRRKNKIKKIEKELYPTKRVTLAEIREYNKNKQIVIGMGESQYKEFNDAFNKAVEKFVKEKYPLTPKECYE